MTAIKLNSASFLGRYVHIVQLSKHGSTFRFARTATTVAVDAADDEYSKAKPFSSIPGPRGLPYFGTLMYYKRGETLQFFGQSNNWMKKAVNVVK